MDIEVKHRCVTCNGTGSYKDFFSISKVMKKCPRCDGTGIETEHFSNRCKYCMTPCNGYCCESCFETFEGEHA